MVATLNIWKEEEIEEYIVNLQSIIVLEMHVA